ncbi:class I SAM-dependent methyltransferase [Mycobacterium sp. TNTM28]|uniref:Class I SAM-dependent methyltransferase n=1 Tax=[Mycobacterium] fortunisiensis TaxID=2600579 RepID=A0ABS6KG41_9MYCO|nr:class I SAM-dependent methyltransferase [[Mycobacterium] fortunisiensis]MBU9762541.1 class I SAM-dependent methyltransferase [[Mycobacterium] fortunisiensis]
MTSPRMNMDWDSAYRLDTPPPWSIGKPQPELAALIDQGKVRSDVLDAGCGHAALSLALAAQGYTVVGLDASATAVAAATATAAEKGLTSATFAQADITAFDGYDGRFATVLDSGLLHSLPPEKRADYVRAISRAAAPGASLYILAFAADAFGDALPDDRPGPRGLTEAELREVVSTDWEIDDVHAAKLYGNDSAFTAAPDLALERDNEGHVLMSGFLLSAHKPA